MLGDDSIILDLVKKVNAITHRQWLQREESIDALRNPSFEDFLIRVNQGIALSSPDGFFFYVSKSLAKVLGYPLQLIYEKGPAFFQQQITTNNKSLVAEMVAKSQRAVESQMSPLTNVRVSFDYHIISGKGDLKRIYQHTLPSAVVYEKKYYTLFILMDLTGFKSSPSLSYRVSYLTREEKYETIARGTMCPPSPHQLTRQESTILKKLASGQSMKAIASVLSISFVTVKKHRQNILRKTGAKNTVTLIEQGLREGWVNTL